MQPFPYLPPKDMWQYDPKRHEKLPTPVDDRGIVDAERLIAVGMQSVSPEYDWREPFTANDKRPYNDIHHLHWPKTRYPATEENATAKEFRNLHINLVNVPRVFHNWLHVVTEPPAVPEQEVMRYYIDAQHVVVSLFQLVQYGKRVLRNPQLDDAKIEQHLIRWFDLFNNGVEEHRKIPTDFQLVDLSTYRGETVTDMFEPNLVRNLGRKAIIPTAVRRITQYSAPL